MTPKKATMATRRAKGGSQPAAPGTALPRRVVVSVLFGTLLNPLNSSMIAVALVALGRDVRVGMTTATWLISGFYLAAAIGTAVQGRLADRYGPRRVFLVGLVIVGLTSAMAALAPSFGWILAGRILLAFGSAAAYPAGLAIFRAAAAGGKPPAQALGAISIASSVSAALGPALGGLLISLADWPAIFWVNIPVVAVGLAVAARWLPSGRPFAPPGASPPPQTLPAVLATLDLPGVALFAATLAALLGFLLTVAGRPTWPLLPLALAAAALLFWRERRAAVPFLDLTFLASNGQLLAVYLQFGVVNTVFYAVFFGLPLWLEQARHFTPEGAGFIVLPIAGIGVLATPLAARLIDRRGARPALLVGAGFLLAGTLLLLTFGAATPVPSLLAVGAILGIPGAFNNLGLQAALYQVAPRGQMGTAAGQFQTFRYIGAILATALLGLAFQGPATTPGLHAIGASLAALSAVLVAVGVRAPGALRLRLERRAHGRRRRIEREGYTVSLPTGTRTIRIGIARLFR